MSVKKKSEVQTLKWTEYEGEASRLFSSSLIRVNVNITWSHQRRRKLLVPFIDLCSVASHLCILLRHVPLTFSHGFVGSR